eukprot:7152100-Prymnesium_polylepis.3
MRASSPAPRPRDPRRRALALCRVRRRISGVHNLEQLSAHENGDEKGAPDDQRTRTHAVPVHLARACAGSEETIVGRLVRLLPLDAIVEEGGEDEADEHAR